MLKLKLLLTLLIMTLTACTTPQYIGKSSDAFKDLSCSVEQESCTLIYGDDGYIKYTVKETSLNTYLISGNVDLNMNIVGGMRPSLSFYVIFIDEETVVYERKVRTGTRKATFEFEVTTQKPITRTTIEKMLFHTWS